jgi:hypothetical protein
LRTICLGWPWIAILLILPPEYLGSQAWATGLGFIIFWKFWIFMRHLRVYLSLPSSGIIDAPYHARFYSLLFILKIY